MKLGIIFIFNNNHNEINVNSITRDLRSNADLGVIMVDNESKDETLEKLKDIKENCPNVSVVEIKKQITAQAAKRAGARYAFNNYSFKHIGYVNVNALNDRQFNINEVIAFVCNNNTSLIQYDEAVKKRNIIKPTLFKSIFSVVDLLENKNRNELKHTFNLIIV